MTLMLRRARCETCIYGPNSPLRKGRLADLKRAWEARDTHQVCHKEAVEKKPEQVMCRGFYDANPGVGQLRRMAERMGWLEVID